MANTTRCVYQCERCAREVYGQRGTLPKGWFRRNGYLLCGTCELRVHDMPVTQDTLF